MIEALHNDTQIKLKSELHSEKKALLCAKAAIEKKALNLKILDLSQTSGFTDYFVIAHGTSDRQIQAMSDSIVHELSEEGFDPLSIEGYSEGRWVLLDFGDVVIHLFQESLREYYDLETLWSDAPRLSVPSEYYGPSAKRLN